jgi:hypothetical protein
VKALSVTFALKKNETVGGCRNENSEELRTLCSSPNTIRVIKLRRLYGRGM